MNSSISQSTVADQQLRQLLQQMDFNWCVRLRDIWDNQPFDIPEAHQELRNKFAQRLQTFSVEQKHYDQSGMVFVGQGGVGKTHLLTSFRQQAIATGATFILVDMTDVHSFWDTLLQGYMDSLQEPLDDGPPQLQASLRRFIDGIPTTYSTEKTLQYLTEAKPARLKKHIHSILGFLSRKSRLAVQHQDAIRAICCLNSNHFEVQTIGHTWLQGQPLDDADKSQLGFSHRQQSPREIVKSISWYLSLGSPTVVAFDQLDPIVAQMKIDQDAQQDFSDQNTTKSIVHQIAIGLSDSCELYRTLPVMTCLETSWHLLSQNILQSLMERFYNPETIGWNPAINFPEQLVQKRTQAAAQKQKQIKSLPYPTWPFHPTALNQLTGQTPRAILRACDATRRKLLAAEQISEVTSFTTDTPDSPLNPVTPTDPAQANNALSELDERFEHLRQGIDLAPFRDHHQEDSHQSPLCVTAFQVLHMELATTLSNQIDLQIDQQFSGRENTRPLHSRLKLVFHDEDDRETHYCLRYLEWANARAFQNRLKAAVTVSGIDPKLAFRNLTILRQAAVPGGPKSAALVAELESTGGRIYQLADAEIQSLAALKQLLDERDPELENWMESRQPLSQRHPELLKAIVPGFPTVSVTPAESPTIPAAAVQVITPETAVPKTTVPKTNAPETTAPDIASLQPTASGITTPVTTPSPYSAIPATAPLSSDAQLVLGPRITPIGNDSPIKIPVSVLARHTMIVAGSGAGKTVTVRRVVEEAALLGLPSLVVDCGGDMCTFDEHRQHPSEFWRPGDSALAKRFAETTEFVVYTPGKASGRNLTLEPIPDLTSLRDNPDELESAIAMVQAALSPLVSQGKSQKAQAQQGILAKSLKFFAQHITPTNLHSYIDLLDALPDEAMLGLSKEEDLARAMADNLRIQLAQDPLLSNSGTPIDPKVLFGDDSSATPGRTRISAISMVGLPYLDQQQAFLNQLSMLLFSWIKQNPHPPNGRALRGLLVIDEARDFIPSGKSSACKDSMIRLAAQARKYKLGLVFATQNPKDLDTKIVGNCATQFFGKMSSPAALNTANDMLQQLGVSNARLPKFKMGQFYVTSPDGELSKPAAIQMPDSLTQARVLEEDDIMAKATTDLS